MKTLKTLLTLLLPLVCAAAYGGGTLDDMRQKADALHAEGKNDSAVVVAEKALAEAVAGGDTTAIVGLNSSLGVYLRTMGKLDESLERYGEAMKLCTTEAYKRRAGEDARQEAAVLYLNLATLHIDMQHKEQAAYYARMCADWTARCADREFKSQVMAQDGLVFLMCGDNKEAARQLSGAYSHAMAVGLHAPALSAAAYMVAVSDRMNDKAAETLWRSRCRELEGEVADTMTLIAYYQILCSVEMNRQNWNASIALFDKILSVKGVDNMPFVVYDCYNNMHDAWAKLGQWHKAYDCLGRAVTLKDSLFEAEKAESMRDLTVKYQSKEKELALARSEAALSQTRMYVAIGVLALFFCAALVLFYVNAQRRKAREREAEFARLKADTDRRLTQRYIEGLESERGRLAKELHDGVCNDLYTVQLRMAQGACDMAEQTHMLSACREQVRRVSHELMPPEFNYADICIVIDDYLQRTGEASGCEVSFTATPDDADWAAVPDATALEMYRIMQEAVANAVKHSGATSIDVTLDMQENSLSLTVTDNGTPAERPGAGIGKRTMRQRAEAVGGRLTVERKDGKTIVQVIISNTK